MSSIIPPIIARDLPGWLSFFDLKSGGQRPQQVAEFVQPTLEMFDWYAFGQKKIAQAFTVGPVALGMNYGHTVPSGKVWLVTALTVIGGHTNTDYAIWFPAYSPSTTLSVNFGVGVGDQPGARTDGGVIPGAAAFDVFSSWRGRLLIRDEGGIGVYVQRVVGTPNTLNVQVEFLELDA